MYFQPGNTKDPLLFSARACGAPHFSLFLQFLLGVHLRRTIFLRTIFFSFCRWPALRSPRHAPAPPQSQSWGEGGRGLAVTRFGPSLRLVLESNFILNLRRAILLRTRKSSSPAALTPSNCFRRACGRHVGSVSGLAGPVSFRKAPLGAQQARRPPKLEAAAANLEGGPCPYGSASRVPVALRPMSIWPCCRGALGRWVGQTFLRLRRAIRLRSEKLSATPSGGGAWDKMLVACGAQFDIGVQYVTTKLGGLTYHNVCFLKPPKSWTNIS